MSPAGWAAEKGERSTTKNFGLTTQNSRSHYQQTTAWPAMQHDDISDGLLLCPRGSGLRWFAGARFSFGVITITDGCRTNYVGLQRGNSGAIAFIPCKGAKVMG